MAQTAAPTLALDLKAEEHAARVELAAAYRLAHLYDMDEMIYTHISLRVPGNPNHYLMKPHDMLFDEVTASSLVKVDLAGNIVGPTDHIVNRAGIAIHGSILAARPDVNCVVHTHAPYTTAVSSIEGSLLPMTQASLRFQGITAYHNYGRAATDPVECSLLAEDFADNWVMILRNHGGLTAGVAVADAFVAAFYLEQACKFQVLAQSTGQPIGLPDPALISDSRGIGPRNEGAAWGALLRTLDRTDPSYRD